MSLRRRIYLLTTSPFKTPEFARSFDRYGIEVVAAPPTADIKSLFAESTPETVTKGDRLHVIAVMKETADLYKYGTNKPSQLLDLERVLNHSQLVVYQTCKEKGIKEIIYERNSEGFIDLSKRQARGSTSSSGGTSNAESAKKEEIFGWDDIFVPRNNSFLSNHELKKHGHKVTSRDMVVSDYIRDHVYYKTKVDLKWMPQGQTRSVDFSNTVAKFATQNPYLSSETAKQLKIENMIRVVSNEGAFFRSAKNRREKNYWLPGLNAGIPFVPKRDAVHETTFMAHDFGHFTIPDLVFTGKVSDELRRVYVCHRMLSEAVTMTMADMLFVLSLKKNKVEYDYSKRKIFPLLEDTGISLDDGPNLVTNIEKIMRANVAYCLRGDDSVYKNFLTSRGRPLTNLEAFKTKYMPFFVEDFRWTVANYNNIQTKSDEAARWWNSVKVLRDVGGISLETVEECADAVRNRPGDIVDRVFGHVFETRVKPFLEPAEVPVVPPNVSLQRAFYRYMMGQMCIFARFSFLPEAAVYEQKLRDALIRHKDTMTIETVDSLRSFYEQFVDVLRDGRLVSDDDAATFKEIFPLFEPFYVNYDAKFETYTNLGDLSEYALGYASEADKRLAVV